MSDVYAFHEVWAVYHKLECVDKLKVPSCMMYFLAGNYLNFDGF